MSNIEVKWGGNMPEMLDVSGATVSARCFGQGALQITDAALFARSVESTGDEAALATWVSSQVMNALREDVGERSQTAPVLAIAADERALAQNIEANVNAMFQPMGASFRVASIHLMIDDATRASLTQSQARTASPVVTAGAPGAIGPGSHVLATWTNGQTYGASVRGFDGTNYEIAWDNGGAVAWIPASAVRQG